MCNASIAYACMATLQGAFENTNSYLDRHHWAYRCGIALPHYQSLTRSTRFRYISFTKFESTEYIPRWRLSIKGYRIRCIAECSNRHNIGRTQFFATATMHSDVILRKRRRRHNPIKYRKRMRCQIDSSVKQRRISEHVAKGARQSHGVSGCTSTRE